MKKVMHVLDMYVCVGENEKGSIVGELLVFGEAPYFFDEFCTS